MTPVLSRTILVLLSGSALAACAATPREPLRPNFPIQAPPAAAQTAPGPQVPPPPAPGDEAPYARPTAPVSSQPLPPPGPVSSQPLPPLATAPSTPAHTPPPAAAPAPVERVVVRTSVTGAVVDADGPPKTHEVKSGDTVYGIAKTFVITPAELAKLNGLKEPYVIRPGQTLKGPAGRAKAYTVSSGDTLFAIARRFGVPAEAFIEVNGLPVGGAIRPGQKLILPDGYKDRGPLRTETRVAVAAPPPTSAPPTSAPPPAAPPPSYARADDAPSAPYMDAPRSAAVPTPAPVAAAPRPPAAAPRPTATLTPPSYARSEPAPAAPYVRPPPASPPVVAAAPRAPATPPPASSARTIVPSAGPTADTDIAAMGRGRFVWPVKGDLISTFGPKPAGQRNDGVNIRAQAGAPVVAAAAGDVVYAGDQVPGFGNLVLVKHAQGWVTAYGHLSRVDVKMQQKVTQGQSIGQAGATGTAVEPQLHFEVRYAPTPADRARPIDPQLVLP